MFDGNVNESLEPSNQFCATVWCARVDGAAGTVTAKLSEQDSPLASVALTRNDKASMPPGTVPENVRVVALNVSHEGHAWPFACIAV